MAGFAFLGMMILQKKRAGMKKEEPTRIEFRKQTIGVRYDIQYFTERVSAPLCALNAWNHLGPVLWASILQKSGESVRCPHFELRVSSTRARDLWGVWFQSLKSARKMSRFCRPILGEREQSQDFVELCVEILPRTVHEPLLAKTLEAMHTITGHLLSSSPHLPWSSLSDFLSSPQCRELAAETYGFPFKPLEELPGLDARCFEYLVLGYGNFKAASAVAVSRPASATVVPLVARSA
jgi:hypothetical protein